MDFIVIGEILKPQGLLGELKIRSLTDDSARYKKLKLVYIDGQAFKIMSLRIDGDMVFLKLSGIESRDDAQKFAGKFVQIDRVNAVELPQNTYFIADLLNCKLLDEVGNELGIIKAVDAYGAADVITAQNGTATLRFPFLNKIVKNVDIENKQFIVFKKLFDEVCVQ